MPRVRLLPECHAETTLVAFLVTDLELYRHSLGSEVVGDMKAAVHDFERVVGIVDTDETTPRHFDSFELISEQDCVQLLRRPTSGEYLIRVTFNGAESFILWNAAQVSLRLTDYGFPEDKKLLRNQLKKLAIETDPNYRRLLTDLRTRQAPGILTLERILNDLIATS